MAKKVNSRFNAVPNTGFGANSVSEGGRLINKDGSVNLIKTGMPFWQRISLYHTLLRLPRWQFLGVIFMFYTALNFLFATIYFLMGRNCFVGPTDIVTNFDAYVNAFFFSSQTLTTVGYGHVAPQGLPCNVIASLESFLGILAFALVTGLLYGRFTRPKAYLLFSDKLLISPYKEGRALMLRLASYKNNHLTEVEAQVTVVLHLIDDNGKPTTKFYTLPLEITKINSMALSWTLVHPLDENSPLDGYTREELIAAKIELFAFIKGFDDHFSNTVQQRTSYTHTEVVYGAKFVPMFERTTDGRHTVLELDKINEYVMVPMPETPVLQAVGENEAANA